SGSAKRLAAVLEMIPLTRFVPSGRGWVGRPSKDRLAIASAFVAKAVYGFATARQLLESLQRDDHLRRLCGWRSAPQVPHEATFPGVSEELAGWDWRQFVHGALTGETQQARLIGHIASDATAIEAREHFAETQAQRAERLGPRKAKLKQARKAARQQA